MCVCVCMCGVVVLCPWLRAEVPEFKPHSVIFQLVFHLPPSSPPSCDWVPGICWGASSRPFLATAMVQVGLRVPTLLAVRKGLFSCRVPSPAPGALLARLTVPA